MSNFLGTLGLCRKAGKIVVGFDAVCDEIKKPKSKVCGVITAKDLSEKTLKEVRFVCDKFGVKHKTADFTMDEINSVIRKKTGIIALLDEGLFGSLTN